MADDYLASIKGFRESAPVDILPSFLLAATPPQGHESVRCPRPGQWPELQANSQGLLRQGTGDKDTSGKIKVSGYGSMDFETDYLYGIAEMPSSWDKEALKAQAVAARTYAYRYMKEGKEICTTEACQVFNKSKSSNPPESWKQAVKETKGKVLEDVVTYYASTHGGYASPDRLGHH